MLDVFSALMLVWFLPMCLLALGFVVMTSPRCSNVRGPLPRESIAAIAWESHRTLIHTKRIRNGSIPAEGSTTKRGVKATHHGAQDVPGWNDYSSLPSRRVGKSRTLEKTVSILSINDRQPTEATDAINNSSKHRPPPVLLLSRS